ncbi:CPBP family intramembrane metalloprotease [Aquimarina sp. TRL1]|uniref:CPBP family intramembrane glutamic endopeptidase n=1 Tax=Aquimarina sp. (strain TRL1) TaxID=2736252 RepID=UPI00158E62DB|nr:CPBP family intramembrane glutamic endopeptidase [Aquimarina sp. TRL1]QKX06817.1 CPBP family intramembrane metalloprotease [Aquimarina sp. TRL1]
MYIEKGKEGSLGMWKYIPLPLAFLGLMAANYWFVTTFDVDVAAMFEQQITEKGKNRFFAENLLTFVIFLGGLFFWVKFVHRQGIRSLTTSRKKIDWKRILFMFILMGLFVVASVTISYFIDPSQFIWNFDAEKFAILFLLSVLLIPFQTSFEEYLFRGYMMQGIGLAARNRWVPLVVTSVLFGLMHLANPEVDKIGLIILVYYIGTGFFLGIITLMDEGLELALGFHLANNLVTALLITANWTAFQTDSLFIDMSEPDKSFEVLLPVFVVFPIFIGILAKKYQWTGWKEKLMGKVS